MWSMRCLFATVVLTACALAQECPTDTVANRCIETAAYKYVNASTAAACCAVCAAEAPTCLVWVLAKPTEARPLPWVPSSDGGVSFNLAAACQYALRRTQHASAVA